MRRLTSEECLIGSPDRYELFGRTLAAIQHHQQGSHGWKSLQSALEQLHHERVPALERLLAECWSARPHITDAHLVTLLSIAVRRLSTNHPDLPAGLADDAPHVQRVAALRTLLVLDEERITSAICDYSNSFTGARRFLIPQIAIAAFADNTGLTEVRLLDLGTGLGVLPRQLNNIEIYDRFARDLSWKGMRTPQYRPIPLSARYGVDAPPLPDLDWVRSCYGPSTYYKDRFAELTWSMERTSDVEDQVHITALDILDLAATRAFIHDHQINAVTCNMVLYQYDLHIRSELIGTIMDSIEPGGMLLSMEPSHGLLRQGAKVEAYMAGHLKPLHVVNLSDAHCIGEVYPGEDARVFFAE